MRALERLGHYVTAIDPRALLPRSIWMTRWLHRTGGFGIAALIERPLLQRLSACAPEVVWVNQGELIGPGLLRKLRANGALVVNYMNDDPFRTDEEWLRFRLYRKALPYYDLAVACRKPNVAELKAAGARRVLLVWMTADEISHKPCAQTIEQRTRYASEVCFVGTWMPERGPFMAELIRRNVPLSIWGDRWHKAREWAIIQPHWRGPGIYGEDYATAILSSKICLGLLSKANRDLHTQRSVEIPALGGLLCAERTSEHIELYREGKEAIFWNDAEECAAMCKAMLVDEYRRAGIASRGHQRAIRNGNFNEPVMAAILDALQKVSAKHT
jgi:spore maturation protein CgeB